MRKHVHILARMVSICMLASAVGLPVYSHAGVGGGIDPAHIYAWSNNDGWVNWGADASVMVTDTNLTGSIWDINNGWINLAPTMGGVVNNGAGYLSGYAWGSRTGWVDFSGVTIDGSGRFHGTATGDVVGIINFDCSTCWVQTYWRATTPVVSGGGGVPPTPSPSGSSTTGTITLPVSTINTNPITTSANTPIPQTVAVAQPSTPPPVRTPTTRTRTSTTRPTAVSTVPEHVDAYNEPLILKSSQSGTLAYDMSSGVGGQIILQVPKGASTQDIVFDVSTHETRVKDMARGYKNSVTYEVIAYWRVSKKPVHTFPKPIQITLPIPPHMRGKAVQTFTKEQLDDSWQSVSGVQVSYDRVSFYVTHLSYFILIAPEDQSAATTTQPTASSTPSPIVPVACTGLHPLIDPYLVPWYVNLFGCVWWPIIVALILIFIFGMLLVRSVTGRRRASVSTYAGPPPTGIHINN